MNFFASGSEIVFGKRLRPTGFAGLFLPAAFAAAARTETLLALYSREKLALSSDALVASFRVLFTSAWSRGSRTSMPSSTSAKVPA